MPRLLGVNIPDNKPILISLGYIYGIGRRSAELVLKEAKIDPQARAKTLTSEQLNSLQEIVKKNYRVEGDLKRDIMMNVKRLKDIMSWRGMRHMRGLPCRGQRTKTNNRTVRGNVRKTVGSGRKPAATPT
ncbi:MAG TPA: 30S ribosomal protein S13 [Candidatus Paceibacterota bacterium]|nr:30S ribosomal protein S13 [Candidatus Pacearchaeota archaeon]HRZ50977.1 30S ribosomal protein S13 [Candidatus Paceibacterota bacterium]HSA36698.1 30S ribosomal protein S13 [Candidatus Paceibacterota bacterium]